MKLTEKKRQNIIDAAIEEFRENGFLAAKTTSIAKRAAVSSRTLYNHFETKEALFDAITEIMIARNEAMDPVVYDPARPLEDQLTEALERYVTVITDPEAIGLNRMVISEFLRDLDRSRAFFAEAASHDYPMTQLIAHAMEAGVLRRADPAFATGQLLALVKNFFFWPEFLLGEKQDTTGVMQDCVAMFLSHYKTDG
ncbi:TetR/AcrR family transcriptional regulator [Shimia marina]|uniref:DNA-binding transcriptional repressor AcrR n=1 Tax=Shimia marina TaxID=321267 RepID=A0A0P1ERN4_9RHOB|nr:TetR/AcrR family transcriptional regulator [Shimia marina]CUH52711.1 DNA-binding transcriptional repressor AcrR [Shimia marina]SFE81937.1 transcriptional regulator, TetR family [Shimia marina]